MTATLSIRGRLVGQGQPAYVIAEMSANHGHRYDDAVRLVHAAKEAGADAVKLQTYTPDTITIDCDRPEFLITGGSLWDGRRLHELYGEAYMPWDWQPKLKAIADDLGIHLFSTPFDFTAVDFLEAMDVPAYKIASLELVDIPLIQRVARTGKPVIMSTGASTLSEIADAVAAYRAANNQALALLKCTSAYPAPLEEMNLATIPHLAAAFNVPVGLSDHTLGIAAPVAAAALGACIIEKHFTLSRSVPGPDNAFSLEPDEFRVMVNAVREAEEALGKVSYEITDHEAPSRAFRRSLYVVRDMRAGEPFTEDTVRSIRPSNGLPPKRLGDVLGRNASHDIAAGTPLSWELLG
jgi:N-acetylneuraminate synthase